MTKLKIVGFENINDHETSEPIITVEYSGESIPDDVLNYQDAENLEKVKDTAMKLLAYKRKQVYDEIVAAEHRGVSAQVIENMGRELAKIDTVIAKAYRKFLITQQ